MNVRNVAAVLFLAVVTPIRADVSFPVHIGMEGTLRTVAGEPRSGPTPVVVALYDDPESRDPLWSEEQSLVPDEKGRYSISIGSRTEGGIPPELFTSGSARWIGIAVRGELEEPRVRIVTVPYAARAADAETIAGRSVEDFLGSDLLRERVLQIIAEERNAPLADRVPPPAGERRQALVQAPAPMTLRPTLHETPEVAGFFEHLRPSGINTALLARVHSTAASGDPVTAVTAVQGEVVPASSGLFSAGVRGLNYGSFGGLGVFGYHAGTGWGVYGYAPTGSGVSGATGTGGVAGVRAADGGTGAGTALELNNGAIRVTGSTRTAFIHTATAGNLIFDSSVGNVATRIDHPLTNNDPEALVFATTRIDDSATSYPAAVLVVYNYSANQWWLWRTTGTFQAGAKFNILVIKQ